MAMTEEELQEQLKNMSPEQLKQFQKQQCIFCHIISGKVASKKVYEDEKVLAVLDINPANPGHILLLPKEHYSILPQIPDEEIGYLAKIAKHLSKAAIKALKVEGTDVFVANGVAAGQRASHFMMHVIPRAEGDEVGMQLREGKLSDKDTKLLVSRLKPVVAKLTGFESTADDSGQESQNQKEEPVRAEQKKRVEQKPVDKKPSLDDIAGLLLK